MASGEEGNMMPGPQMNQPYQQQPQDNVQMIQKVKQVVYNGTHLSYVFK